MKSVLKYFSYVILFLFFFSESGLPQESTVRIDSVNSEASDGAGGSVEQNNPAIVADEIKPADTGLEAPVEYTARSFHSDFSKNITYLIGDAEVKYKKMTLQAGKITIFWDTHSMVAEGLPDTLRTASDSTNGLDTVKVDTTHFKGLPVFSDGKEKMTGAQMEYNFKTERGRVVRGRTEIENGYYAGDAIKRVAPEEFDVLGGSYTTCDSAAPHYHFSGKKMKIIMNDKVIARPVVFYIGKIPVAILPFAFYPTRSGRHSGIIIPQFGTSTIEGRYLRNLGYYWATNDYMDMRFTLDFFERTGVLFRTFMNYALRYNFRGSLGGSITRKSFDNGRSERRWDFRINHNHEISPTTRFSVDASFVSNNSFYREFSQNRDERLNRVLVSNATFSKNWSEGRRSLSLNLSQTKDLQSGRTSKTLPRMQLNFSRSQIFPFKSSDRGGATRNSSANARWYNYFYYGYTGSFLNTIDKDSTREDVRREARHSMNFSFSNPKKVFGWLSINHNLNFNEDWFDRSKTFVAVGSNNDIQEGDAELGFAPRHTFSYSASANTNVYGMFNTGIGPIKAFRHRMSPSISFNYQPDFSSDFWGYYQTVRDSAGNEVLDSSGQVIRRDRFGGTPSGEQKSMSFSLNNLFQMKWGEGENPKKIDLFNLNFTGGYNFAADQFNWNDLSTSFRANPRPNLNVNMNLRHSFYEYDEENHRQVNNLLFKKPGFFNFLRMTSFRFDLRWSIQGNRASPNGPVVSSLSGGPASAEVEQVGQEGAPTSVADRFQSQDRFSAFDIPWRAAIAFSFSNNRFDPTRPTKIAYLDVSNVEVQLTRNWRIGYRLRYDIEGGEIADQQISFYRDLHCWEAQFTWNPSSSGIGRGFFFRINIKAAQLSDIKIEHRGGTPSVFNPF